MPAARDPVLLIIPPGRARQASGKTAAFEVVSLEPAADTSMRRLEWTEGRFRGNATPFIVLVNMAYGGGASMRFEDGESFR